MVSDSANSDYVGPRIPPRLHSTSPPAISRVVPEKHCIDGFFSRGKSDAHCGGPMIPLVLEILLPMLAGVAVLAAYLWLVVRSLEEPPR